MNISKEDELTHLIRYNEKLSKSGIPNEKKWWRRRARGRKTIIQCYDLQANAISIDYQNNKK